MKKQSPPFAEPIDVEVFAAKNNSRQQIIIECECDGDETLVTVR